MASPPLRTNFTDNTTPGANDLAAAEYNLNATRTDSAYDNGLVAYKPAGTDVALADGGTGASLADPNGDRIMFWDDSAGTVTWLAPGSGTTITGTTLTASGGGGSGTSLGWINVKDPAYGAAGDGTGDDSAAIRAAIAALPSTGGGVLFFPPGTYTCNTPVSGVILNFVSKDNITVIGYGANIRTFTANTTEIMRVDTCNDFKLYGVSFIIEGSSVIEKALHITCGSPAGARRISVQDVLVRNLTSSHREAFDVMTVSGSPVIYSARAAFTAGDVGDPILINYRNSPRPAFTTTVSSVQTLTSTLSGAINSAVTTVTLSAALSTMPASGWTFIVDNERMWVTAGGNTTTLTVVRGRGAGLYPAFGSANPASHASGATITVYKATLAANVPFTTAEPAASMRIENGTAHINYGVCIGTDHPGASDMDLATIRLSQIVVDAVQIAGFSIGNGVSGNILDHWAHNCGVAASSYGFLMHGGSISLHSCDFGSCLVDIKRGQPTAYPIVIEDLRTEVPAMVYEYVEGYSSGPGVTISNWLVSDTSAEDGVQLVHITAEPLTLINVQFNTSSSQQSPCKLLVQANSSSNPGSLVAVNVSHNGTNPDPFVTSNVQRTIVGISQSDTGTFIPKTGIDGSVKTTVAVPASSSSAGIRGQTASDASFAYECYATNSWRRWAVSSF